jgi:MoxR-like ATPase
MMTIQPRQLPDVLRLSREMKKPLMIWGAPGIGKTQQVAGYCATENFDFYPVLLTTKTPADIGGLPALDHEAKTTVFYRPEFFPADQKRNSVLFFDELSSADDMVRLAAYSIIQERRQGTHVLPDGCQIVAAGNRPEDGCPAFDMGRAMNDRFLHVTVEANAKDWLLWADDHGIHPSVSAFIARNPQRLQPTEAEIQSGNVVLPSPRSWEAVSRACFATQDDSLLDVAVAGLVGELGAHEFSRFREATKSMASVDTILATPKEQLHEVIPASIDGLYTLMYAFSSVVASKNLAKILDVVGEFERISTMPEFAKLGVMLDIESLGMSMIAKKVQDASRKATILEMSSHPAFKRFAEREKLLA